MISHCPKCSSEIVEDSNFCPSCGFNLAVEYIEVPVCPICKKTYPENEKFCIDDGAKLLRQGDLVPRCVICNTPYDNEVKFCPLDGGAVTTMQPAQYQQSAFGQPIPQNINGRTFKNPKASLGERFLAALIDGMISFGLLLPAFILLFLAWDKSLGDNNGEVLSLFLIALLLSLIPLAYNLAKDGLGAGQSWGKRTLGLMVINLDNNTPCDFSKSFFRNIISFLVCLIPFIGWAIEPVMILATEDGRKLADKSANTQVINKKYYL